MKQFDDSVKAAAAAFREMGWTWGIADCEEPTLDTIRSTFLENLRACVFHETQRKYTNGRLTVELDPSEPSVTFSLELESVYGDDVFRLLGQVE